MRAVIATTRVCLAGWLHQLHSTRPSSSQCLHGSPIDVALVRQNAKLSHLYTYHTSCSQQLDAPLLSTHPQRRKQGRPLSFTTYASRIYRSNWAAGPITLTTTHCAPAFLLAQPVVLHSPALPHVSHEDHSALLVLLNSYRAPP